MKKGSGMVCNNRRQTIN